MNQTQLGLSRSVSEEHEAARRYRARARIEDALEARARKSGNPKRADYHAKVAKRYRHIAGEEDVHAHEFRELL